jgi:adenylate cyclase
MSGERAKAGWRRFKHLPSGYWAIALLIVALVVLRIADPEFVERLRFAQFDLMQRMQPRETPNSPVVIVDIDEKSLNRLGQWPWPRTVLANLVTRLTAAGAAAVGFDVVFPEADRTSPGQIAETVSDLSPSTRDELARHPSNDSVFADSIKRARVVLGMAPQEAQPDASATFIQTPLALLGGNPRPHLYAFPGVVSNLPELDKVALGRGFFALTPESDGVVRRVPAVVRSGDVVIPAVR